MARFGRSVREDNGYVLVDQLISLSTYCDQIMDVVTDCFGRKAEHTLSQGLAKFKCYALIVLAQNRMAERKGLQQEVRKDNAT